MPGNDSGSDGENGENRVRERLRQTSIAKGHRSDVAFEANPSKLSGNAVEKSEDGSPPADTQMKDEAGLKRLEKKRALEDVGGNTDGDEANEEDKKDDASSIHQRKKTREGHSSPPAAEPKDDIKEDDDTQQSNGKEKTPEKDTKEGNETVLSPRRKRSREDLDSEEPERNQKLPTTDESRARRSSEEERGEEEKKKEQAKAKYTFGSGFGNTSNASPFASLSGSKSPEEQPRTSKTAFAASGFASMTGTSSPFGSLGSSNKGSSTTTSTQAATDEKDKPRTFGSGFGSGTSAFTSSSFLGAGAGKTFGSGLSGGFGGGAKLTSFAAPVGDMKVGSEPKPLGADDDSGTGDEDGSDSEGGGGTDEASRTDDDPNSASKKPQNRETGEEHENTLIAKHGKLFQFHREQKSWKERGIGTIKLNIPRPDSGSDDEDDEPDPEKGEAGSKDGDKEEKKQQASVPRFVMRNNATHKIILNTRIGKELNVSEDGKRLNFMAVPIDTPEVGLIAHTIRMSKEEDVKELARSVREIIETTG